MKVQENRRGWQIDRSNIPDKFFTLLYKYYISFSETLNYPIISKIDKCFKINVLNNRWNGSKKKQFYSNI